jgi:ABC-type lipoprotein release transport system permease subunit
MRRQIEIAKTGLTAILIHPARSLVTFCALLAMLVPFATGLGISRGIARDAESSVNVGGDLYLSGSRFGRSAPLPLELLAELESLEGVVAAVPRIVGRLALGRERVEVVLVGVPADRFPESITCLRGRLPGTETMNEFVVGTDLAARLRLDVGALLPPFYRNARGEHISRIVGVFDADVSLWQSRLMFCTLETALLVYDQEGLATDFVIRCQPGYAENLDLALRRMSPLKRGDFERPLTLHVTSRDTLQSLRAGSQWHREGVFNLRFVPVLAIGILVIMVVSGVGHSERRREIGILKATGWQTDEILLRCLVESVILSLAGAAASLLLAWIWLRPLNGYWIAGIFLPGVSASPNLTVPFQLAPVAALWSTWRSAVVPPSDAMR